MYEPGRPLCYLFLEKIFQLSVSMPTVDDKLKQQFWEHLISNMPDADQETYVEKLENISRAQEQDFEKL